VVRSIPGGRPGSSQPRGTPAPKNGPTGPAQRKYDNPLDSISNRPGTPGPRPSGGGGGGGPAVAPAPVPQGVASPAGANYSSLGAGGPAVAPAPVSIAPRSGASVAASFPRNAGVTVQPYRAGVTGMAISTLTAQPAESSRLAGFERRVESQAARQEGFNSFMEEDRGGYSNPIARIVADKPDVQNIRSFSNVVTGGTNLNPFSDRFGIQTPREQRGRVGRFAEDLTFGALGGGVIGLGGGVVMAGEKTALTAEALTIRDTRRNIAPELARSGRSVAANEFSFLPGGTPINEAGAQTLAAGVLFAGLGARPARIGTVKTGGPVGPIDVVVRSPPVRGTGSGVRANPPVSRPPTSVLRFTEDVLGVQRFTRGRVAETTVTIRPSGAVNRVTRVGRYRFEVDTPAGGGRPVASEFRGGQLVRSRVLPMPRAVPVAPVESRPLTVPRETGAVLQGEPNVLVQSKTVVQSFEITQPIKGGTVRGVLEGLGESGARTTAGPSSRVRSASLLETRPALDIVTGELGTATSVVKDVVGVPRSRVTRLRLGTEAEVARNEFLRSSNVLDIGKPLVDETGLSVRSSINRRTVTAGEITTDFFRASNARGTFFIEPTPSRYVRARAAVVEFGGRVRRRAGLAVVGLKMDVTLIKARRLNRRMDAYFSEQARKEGVGVEVPKPVVDVPVRPIVRDFSSMTAVLDAQGMGRARGGRGRRGRGVEGEGLVYEVEAPRGGGRLRPGRDRGVVVEPVRAGVELPRSVDVGGRAFGGSRYVPMLSPVIVSGVGSRSGLPEFKGPQSVPVFDVRIAKDTVRIPRYDVPTVQDLGVPELLRPRVPKNPGPGVPGAPDFGVPEVPFTPGAPFPLVGALPFGGGGGSGFDLFDMRRTRFKNRYSPSIQGGLLGLSGSRRAANLATVSGLGVRPAKIV